LLIRADANRQIGVGHVMRCLALAQAWASGSGPVTFLARPLPKALQERLRQAGYEVCLLAEDLSRESEIAVVREVLQQQPRPPVLVVDGYDFDELYQDAWQVEHGCLVVIDDLGHCARYHADLILNQNLNAHPGLYGPASRFRRLLLGPKFALLRQEFQPRPSVPPDPGLGRQPKGATHLLVTMGGADPPDATSQVVARLRAWLPGLAVDVRVRVLVGAAYPHRAALDRAIAGDPRFEVVVEATSMRDQYQWADVALCAGGASNWEMSCLGVPRVVIPIADNQRENLPHMVQAGLCLACELDDPGLPDVLAQLLGSPQLREQMRTAGQSLVDGWGAARVVAEIQIELAAH
jgi:UDP-2,4-diacetamido-2,4,6-trideoxy-beta-L-altropyranose hydrolase